ncbi:MAG: malate dehydrogenase [Euryarchaeota archaeon RBG_16_68_12]|nr:MAG: malate dehydrogenase [Euryarchaeota archaeon RBG_16_68_12]
MGKEEVVEGSVWVPEPRLREFVTVVFRRLGVPLREARVTAEVLTAADLRGIGSHGVARLPRYVGGIKSGAIVPKDPSKIVKQTRVTALIDGGNGLGQVVGRRAMDLAVKKAREGALGFVAVRNSNHFGIAGYYSMMALKAGMIGIASTNAAPLVVPTYGRNAVLGTNPISVAVPTGSEEPFVLDMATSVVPRGTIEVYDRQAKEMPLGWAVDTTGRSTSSPKAVLEALAKRLGGGILPLGGEGEEFSGHKGYGLALLVDILCGALPGAATGLDVYGNEKAANVGHFFGAIDVRAFRPLREFRRDMDRLLRTLRESPKADGHDRIYVHGEKSFTVERERKAKGIPLGPKVAENLRKIGADVGVPWIA